MVAYYLTIAVELIFFIYISHLIITWLGKDKRYNMVGYFVLYIAALTVTQQAELVAVHSFLYGMAPVFTVLFLLFHQEQLQKNFVTITQAHVQGSSKNNNLDIVTIMLQIGLHNSMNKKNSFFIVEGNQDLTLLLQAAVPLHIPLQKELVEGLCDSPLYNEYTAIWLQYTGVLKGINSSLIQNMHFENKLEIVNNATDILCKKTDCFTVMCNAMGLWTFKNEHHIHEALSTAQIQKLCKQKIELLNQQRSFVYVSGKATDNQSTVS